MGGVGANWEELLAANAGNVATKLIQHEVVSKKAQIQFQECRGENPIIRLIAQSYRLL